MRPGDTVYWAHPDEVEPVVLVERGTGGFNLKSAYRRSLRDPWVVRTRRGEEGVADASTLYADPAAAAIRSAELAAELEEEDGGPRGRGRLPHDWANWPKFAKRFGGYFIEWAEPAPRDPSEERFAIVYDRHSTYVDSAGKKHPGSVLWARVSPNPDVPIEYSGGNFYGDMPGGAIEAARRAAMKKKQQQYR